MKHLIILLILLCTSFSFCKEIILHCDFDGRWAMNDYYYIDTKSEVIGKTFYAEERKQWIVFNWWFKNIKFSKTEITFSNPEFSIFSSYEPELAWLVKNVIDRVNLTDTHYSKDLDSLADKLSFLPLYFVKVIGRITLDFKYITSHKCKINKMPKEIYFMSKKERNYLINKSNEKNNRPKF